MTRRLPLILAAVLSVLVALLSYRFLALGLRLSFPDMGGHIDGARLAFLVHISASPVALALATFQLLPGLRARRPGLHRWAGRAYGVAILIGGLGALGMLPTSNGGVAAQVGFGLLAVFWIGTTGIAIRHAMARRIADHRRWMIRSFALTFAAVTLRVELPILIFGFGLTYAGAIAILSWLCWMPNALVAELWLARGQGVKPRLMWSLVAATAAVYLVMVLWSLPHLSALAGGAAMFDMRLTGYDFGTAMALIAALGPEGRDFYLNVQQGFDTAFPLLEAASFTLAFLRLFPGRIAVPLSIVSFIGAVFDELENAVVATMLRAGPDGLTEGLVATASQWTLLKSASITVLMTAVFLGIARVLWQRRRAPA